MKKYGKYETKPVAAAAKQPKVKSALLQTYITSLLCMVLCVSMFFGTSFAWFTSEVTDAGNEINVGILKVGLYKDTVAQGNDLSKDNIKLFDGNIRWEPGYTSLETIKVVNEGDLAFKYEMAFTSADADVEAVAKNFEVWVFNHYGKNYTKPRSYEVMAADSNWVKIGTLAEVLNGKHVLKDRNMYTVRDTDANTPVNANTTDGVGTVDTYTIALHMNQSASDAALMGKKITLNVKLTAYQMGSEQDSFGDDYDDTANAPVVNTAEELQTALDSADKDIVIQLGSDIAGTVTVNQPGDKIINIVIDGKGHKYDGQIKIKGNSTGNHDDTLTIRNINFETKTQGQEFVWSADSSNGSMWRYAHNVTIDNCTFTASDAAVHTAVGIKFQQAYNIKVTNCTAIGMHTLLQAESCGSTVAVENSKVVNGKNGVSFNNTKTAIIKNSKIASVADGGYGVRHKGEVAGYSLHIENCDISAFVPVLIRNMTATGYTATLEGINTLTATANNQFGYQIVISANDWDNDDAQPAAPTGTYTLTGAEGLSVFAG